MVIRQNTDLHALPMVAGCEVPVIATTGFSMFDRIRVMIPLPGYPDEGPRNDFWTTDFGCDETVFAIDEDGRLSSELWHREPVPENEQEFRDDLNCLLRAGGEVKKVVDGWVRRDYDGIIHFSRYCNDKLYEFEAEFSMGVLQSVKPV